MDGYEPLTSSHDRAFAEFVRIYAESIPMRERLGCLRVEGLSCALPRPGDDPPPTLGDPIVLGSALHVDAGARG